MRPLVARDAALSARIETLLFRYEQPEEMAWGVDHSRGFQFDWCIVGGRWEGWGRQVRRLMVKQKIQPSGRPIPQFLERNAVWSEDVGRVHISSLADYPLAVITPHGDWVDCPSALPVFGKATARQRNAKSAWSRTIQGIMKTYPDCLAVAIDYHY
jgi:hypothetical protein